MKIQTNITLITTPTTDDDANRQFSLLNDIADNVDRNFSYPSVLTMEDGQIVLKVMNITSADDYFDIHEMMQAANELVSADRVDLPELLKQLNDKHLPKGDDND